MSSNLLLHVSQFPLVNLLAILPAITCATLNHTRLLSRLSSALALAATPHLNRHQALCCSFFFYYYSSFIAFADSDCGSKPPAAPTSGTLPPSGSRSCDSLKSQTINLNWKKRNICGNFPWNEADHYYQYYSLLLLLLHTDIHCDAQY